MLNKKDQRIRRSRQTRARIAKQRVVRLSIFRTNLHIYASVISDDGARVLASASTAEADVRKELGGAGKGATVRGLGLRKLNSVSELEDTPAVRGMITKVAYLVKVQE